MKKLQNNFTTPEQSKRLLELGVPADSADCYLTRFGIDEDWEVKALNHLSYSEIAINNQEYCNPCWSVGRLIEIFRKLCPFGDIIGELIMMNDDIVESFVNEFENPNVKWNFSKLEE